MYKWVRICQDCQEHLEESDITHKCKNGDIMKEKKRKKEKKKLPVDEVKKEKHVKV